MNITKTTLYNTNSNKVSETETFHDNDKETITE